MEYNAKALEIELLVMLVGDGIASVIKNLYEAQVLKVSRVNFRSKMGWKHRLQLHLSITSRETGQLTSMQ